MHEVDVLISALEHYAYCPRQCALIHLEQTFDENLYTVRGELAHERVHSGEITVEAGIRVLRAVDLWSEEHGLRGKADVVELHGSVPFPIEYKSGGRVERPALVQLCAQALCLEEMTGERVPAAAVFVGATKRRREVPIDGELRETTIGMIDAVRAMLLEQIVPPPVNDRRCPNCSLVESCLPDAIASRDRLRGLQGTLFQPGSETCTSS
jgi:CRISPR-associated exonuclease Cas4